MRNVLTCGLRPSNKYNLGNSLRRQINGRRQRHWNRSACHGDLHVSGSTASWFRVIRVFLNPDQVVSLFRMVAIRKVIGIGHIGRSLHQQHDDAKDRYGEHNSP